MKPMYSDSIDLLGVRPIKTSRAEKCSSAFVIEASSGLDIARDMRT